MAARVFILFMMLLFCTSAKAQEYFIDGSIKDKDFEIVKFIESNDPGYMILKTEKGEQYTANFYYSLISSDDISEWSQGEKVAIKYSEKQGLGIVRQKTGKFYKVFFEDSPSPIENWKISCKNNVKPEMHYNDCFSISAQMWTREQKLFLDFAQGQVKKKSFSKSVVKSEKAWQAYRETVMESYRESRPEDDGTIASTYAAMLSEQMEKSRYEQVLYMYK
jgi:hypothetical protein